MKGDESVILDTSLSQALEEAKTYFDPNYSMSLSLIREISEHYNGTLNNLELIEIVYLLGFMQGQKKK